MSKVIDILKTTGKLLLYLLLSLVLALFIRLFLCNFYRVPSDSMAPAVLPGDFIMANKWSYGARLFKNLEFTKYTEPPVIRAPGFSSVKRNDVVVFNFPYRENWDTICMNMSLFFVKRCIGLPGDSLSVRNGFYRVSGQTDTLGYIPEQKRVSAYRGDIEPVVFHTFPFDSTFNWNIRNFGPWYIPVAGQTIALNNRNFVLYRKLIAYETGKVIEMADSSILIGGFPAVSYTFSKNWYFMAGDNVLNSQDSRYIGLIPENFIIGKASLILSSKNRDTGKKRWNRMMKSIK